MRVHTDWLLTAHRAAIHLPSATAVVADLHLGYAQRRRRAGDAVPLHESRSMLAPLIQLADEHHVHRIVIAGDCFEDGRGEAGIAEWLDEFRAVGLELVALVPGNHDRGIERFDKQVPLFPSGVTLGEWQIVHGDGVLPEGRVMHGHFHPCLRWNRRTVAPCFLVGPKKLVLPAFSSDAAGVNVVADRRWRGLRCCVIVGSEVLDFGSVEGLPRLRGHSCKQPLRSREKVN